MRLGVRVEVLGRERRRRWSDEQKLTILNSVGVNGATLTQVANQYGITRQQIYNWRHQMKRHGVVAGCSQPAFLALDMPVVMANEELVRDEARHGPSLVELQLCRGRSLRFDTAIDANALTRLIQAVEAA